MNYGKLKHISFSLVARLLGAHPHLSRLRTTTFLPANFYDAPFAQQLLEWAKQRYQIRRQIIHLDAAYWSLRQIVWIHRRLGAVAVVAYNPKNRKKHSCLPSTWTREELSKRSSTERFFGRFFLFFHLQHPPYNRLV